MEPEKGVVEKGKSVRDMHHLRLMSLLQELERDNGRKKTAELLGVDRRTLDASLDEGVLTRRIRNALQKALQSGVGSAAAEQRDRNDLLADRLEDLEGRVEEQGKETRANHRAWEDAIRAVREEVAQAVRKLEWAQGTGAGHAGAGPSQAEAAGSESGASGMGRKPPPRPRLRREYPDLVTLVAAEDDEEVFGEVWPLVVEWRELKAVHPDEGKSLSWLRTEERFLALELTLLEEHGLTLPPATFPLRGFDRNGQVNWRKTALSDTRRALKKREFLNTLAFRVLWK